MIQVAVLGYGVVGSGVVEVLDTNRDIIQKRLGEAVAVKYILDKRDFPGSPYGERFTKEFSTILEDPAIAIVAEAMGGIEPAYSFAKQALSAGKSVVTSNKELVAAKGAELLALARAHDVNFFFEASVGGGIPVIRPLHQCLGGNRITRIAGILNGTTNYILTKMIQEEMSFEQALAQATALGYAEADPTADVDGHDACRKICILAALAFGKHIYPEWVDTQGIRDVSTADVQYAAKAGCVIKLIGQATQLENGQVECFVSPALVPLANQLAGIDDVFNGVFVHGDMVDDVVFYGRGAGKLPTASAMVGDIMDCAQRDGNCTSLWWENSETSFVADGGQSQSRFYVRLVGDKTAVETLVGEMLSPQQDGEIAFVTAKISRGQLEQALAERNTKVQALFPVLDC